MGDLICCCYIGRVMIAFRFVKKLYSPPLDHCPGLSSAYIRQHVASVGGCTGQSTDVDLHVAEDGRGRF